MLLLLKVKLDHFDMGCQQSKVMRLRATCISCFMLDFMHIRESENQMYSLSY